MTALVVLVSLVFAEPVLFVVAVPLAVVTYAFWYHSSGTLRQRLDATRRATADPDGRQRGGFGAGPREGFAGARGRQARTRSQRRRQRYGDGESPPRQQATAMSRKEAYRRLGLDESADDGDIQRAYRERVKETHPDRGGDKEEFKAITEAYERLTG